MSVRQMMCAFENVLTGTRVCWMRDEHGMKASVMAIIPESNKRAADGNRSNRLADRAKKVAEREARRIGNVMSAGVFMGGEGLGSVSAIGIADLALNPETERRLSNSGIPQVQ